MTKYQEFLEANEVIPEDLFNEVISSLPEVDINEIKLDDLNSLDELSQCIINIVLEDWKYVYSENVDFENKTFRLEDVDSLSDLEEIKEKFQKWTISNYDEVIEQLESDSEDKEFYNLIDTLRMNATIEQLRKFVNEL